MSETPLEPSPPQSVGAWSRLPAGWLARDIAWSQRLSRWGQRRAYWLLAYGLARSGDTLFWLVIIGVGLAKGWGVSWRLLWTVLATAVLVFAVKGIFKRKRPSGRAHDFSHDQYSFPSGHAARVTAVAVTLSFAQPAWLGVWLVWATAVSLSRVILARHYLSDITAGWFVGLAVGLIIQQLPL